MIFDFKLYVKNNNLIKLFKEGVYNEDKIKVQYILFQPIFRIIKEEEFSIEDVRTDTNILEIPIKYPPMEEDEPNPKQWNIRLLVGNDIFDITTFQFRE